MLNLVEYTVNGNGIQICRCYGEGGYAQLPESVDGLPVTALADHAFAREPSFVLRGVPKAYARMDEAGVWRAVAQPDLQQLKAVCAQEVREIILPQHLRMVGNYAFYGCHALTRITVPAGLSNLGSGAFVDCNHVQEVAVMTEGEEENESRYGSGDVWQDRRGADGAGPLPAVRQVLSEISYEVEIRICDRAGRDLLRIHYPEYYEDSQENTPARIFVMKYEGTGFKYRQCFANGRIDLARYDALFYEASVQEYVPTIMQIALDRLFYPEALSDGAKEAYIGYLLEDPLRLVRWCMPDESSTGEKMQTASAWDAFRIMDYLCREERLDRDSLAVFLDGAVRAGRADVVSLLQEHRRTHFARQRVRERYEL